MKFLADGKRLEFLRKPGVNSSPAPTTPTPEKTDLQILTLFCFFFISKTRSMSKSFCIWRTQLKFTFASLNLIKNHINFNSQFISFLPKSRICVGNSAILNDSFDSDDSSFCISVFSFISIWCKTY